LRAFTSWIIKEPLLIDLHKQRKIGYTPSYGVGKKAVKIVKIHTPM